MTGGYRRVFQKPKDYEWELLTYKDGNIPLAQTDMDQIVKSRKAREENFGNVNNNGKNLIDSDAQPGVSERAIIGSSEVSEVENDGSGSNQTEISGSTDTQEIQRALKLSFTLPASCYATMAIRELLKTSTSVAFHKTLNP